MRGVTAPSDESAGLMGLLAELGRLDPDLLVRDQEVSEAVATLQALREELRVILERADGRRRGLRARLAALERELAGVWPGAAAAESLRRLVEVRRELVELDASLQPAQVLFEEVDRRCSRRTAPTRTQGRPAAGDGHREAKEPGR